MYTMKLKRFLGWMLAIATVLGLLPSAVLATGAVFTDVPENSWFREAVAYVTAEELMVGVGYNKFVPQGKTTRAMVVTVLHRMEGTPEANSAGFDDVAENRWYTDAIDWAKAEGIVEGYGDGTFRPNDAMTREEMVAVFYRYTDYKGYDTTATKTLRGYADRRSVQTYAVDAMEWAVSTGLINGFSDGTVRPREESTRAQLATVLMRFHMFVSNAIPADDPYDVYVPNLENIVTDTEDDISYVNNMIIIIFSEDASDEEVNRVIDSVDGKVVGCISSINQYQVEIAARSLDELRAVVEKVEENDCVLFAHYDRAYKNLECSISPNDPWDKDVGTEDWQDSDVDGSNWWLEAIEASAAWEHNDKFSTIKIGVIDNGFDTGHEDLNVTFPMNYEQLNNKEDHGTHVAGIIGATPNNRKGITGIVWKSELVCYDWQPTLWQELITDWETDTMVYAGLIFTVQAGAKVVNFSIGASGDFPEGNMYARELIDEEGEKASGYLAALLRDHDFVIVQSAGNGGVDAENNGMFASINNGNCATWGRGRASAQGIMNRILIVAAVERSNDGYLVSSFSCGGDRVNISAPGGNGSHRNDEDIYSTVTGGLRGKYKALAGTSMAAPIVTGVASLVWSVNDSFTGDEVVDIVCSNTALIARDNSESTQTSGNFPIVNAKLAVEEAVRRTETGTLSGKISKASDRITAIPNASVEVYKDGVLYKTSTSNSNGNYTINLPAGRYLIKISSEGYIDFKAYATVEANENTYMETFLLIEGSEAEFGVASGTVVNSLTGTGVAGVTLMIRRDWNNDDASSEVIKTVVTDSNGNYSVEMPLGNYSVIATKNGFTASSFNIIVQAGTTGHQNGTITPLISGDDYLVTLTWGQNPRDLDSHVVGTLSNGARFHVYYSHESQRDGNVEVCNLDYDDTDGYGPEHITLNTTNDKAYYYYVYKFAGSGTIANSDAKITVEQGNTLIAEFNVPTDLGDGNYWNVFAIKNGELIVNNTITSAPALEYAN